MFNSVQNLPSSVIKWRLRFRCFSFCLNAFLVIRCQFIKMKIYLILVDSDFKGKILITFYTILDDCGL